MDAEHPYAVPGVARRLANLPPTLVLSGMDDPMRDEARAYAERLRDAGIAATYRLVANGKGWPDALYAPLTAECPCAADVQQEFRSFFEATLPPKQAHPDKPSPC
jgi:acetyl esterase/lipase